MVGFIPTMPFTEDGPTMEPPVSVPMVAAAKLIAVATPDPLLEPAGLLVVSYGFFGLPPTVLPWNEAVLRNPAN